MPKYDAHDIHCQDCHAFIPTRFATARRNALCGGDHCMTAHAEHQDAPIIDDTPCLPAPWWAAR